MRIQSNLALPLLTVLAVLAAFAMTGCVSEPRATATTQNSAAPFIRPAPKPAEPAAPLATDWQDAPITPGQWIYRRDERGSIALFGMAGADALATMRCVVADRRIFVSRRALAPSNAALTMTLRASTSLKSFPAALVADPLYVAAEIGPRDAQLDAIAFSRGRFMIVATGQADIIVPAWAEVTRVIEDCR